VHGISIAYQRSAVTAAGRRQQEAFVIRSFANQILISFVRGSYFFNFFT
jgi:hypothetical protein